MKREFVKRNSIPEIFLQDIKFKDLPLTPRIIPSGLRTWIELNKEAARHNIRTLRRILKPQTKLMAVVKSNAYGHGLVTFSKMISTEGIDGFCVDSVLEAFRLREEGIKKPILVLGNTLPEHFRRAAASDITLTISNFDALKAFLRVFPRPNVHLKIDTGMHRQGFFPKDVMQVTQILLKEGAQESVRGMYTHFAAAKDITYPHYTEQQFKAFLDAERIAHRAGLRNLIRHVSATAGALIDKKYNLDWVRSGIALYGYFPSRELEVQRPHIKLRPVLSWHALISEIKLLPKGEFLGYDLTEYLEKPSKIAILPIGYWHGIPGALSSTGLFITSAGKLARILGKVTMDMTVIDITDSRVKVGDTATLYIKDAIAKSGTSAYEFLTRLNPLIERIVV